MKRPPGPQTLRWRAYVSCHTSRNSRLTDRYPLYGPVLGYRNTSRGFLNVANSSAGQFERELEPVQGERAGAVPAGGQAFDDLLDEPAHPGHVGPEHLEHLGL